jgi:hypothetical protein
VRIDAAGCGVSVPSVCSDFGSAPGIATMRRTAMVRKGSPVRVRQRALTKCPLVAGACVLGPHRSRPIAEHPRNTAP